jgi:hypothetical protein
MPQLDLMTFFTQFFWFSLGFSFFYIFLLHFIMPSIALNLKFRRKKLELLANDINKKKESVSGLLTTYDNILFKTLNFSRTYVAKIVNYGNSWITSSISKTNSNNFVQANTIYIKTIGEKNFSFVLMDATFKNSVKDKNWVKLWKK